MTSRWYEQACVYSLDVRAFCDSNGDGFGDLRGVISRLDYLHGLGVSAIWLQPIYATPFRDNGYDVSDYYAIDPRVGTLHDFIRLVEEANGRALRVIMDLVVNHTSNEHRWFEEARRDPDSPYRDYYVWCDEPKEVDVKPIFPGHQGGVWAYDQLAKRYFLHRFYDFQPDLNIANLDVQREIRDIVRFWTNLGVSGFRIDAAPYIVKKAGWAGGDGHRFMRELHDYAESLSPDVVLMAETDVGVDEYEEFFGGGRELDLLFNFYFNNHLFLSLARQEAGPVEHALEALPKPPPSARYANWLRNHDELDLERLTDEDREEVYAAFAPEEEMRLYNRGIRRRLAPMLGGDHARLLSAFSILFGLPGVPMILYGDELGMGDDLSLPQRESVRTPMQWDDTRNAGFSSAPSSDLVRPVIEDGEFAYKSLNWESARLDAKGLPGAIERIIRARHECPEIGRGGWQVAPTSCAEVLAVRHEWAGRVLLVLTNLSDHRLTVELDIDTAFLEEVVSDSYYKLPQSGPYRIELNAYGFRWLRGPLAGEPA